jgi:single-stranded-DNA-specific exonuclease
MVPVPVRKDKLPCVTAPRKVWHLRPADPDAARHLARSAGVSEAVAQLLLQRGLTSAVDAKAFLDSPMTAWHSPDALPGVPVAADRLFRAAVDKKKVCVFGDYDADGVTGTALLLRTLHRVGAVAEFYIPNRLDEGYGLNVDALRTLKESGVETVVTVDCGITGCEAAAAAKDLGLELIVTDHHELGADLPCAAVLVHPRLPGSTYPFGGLSGAGVAFKLAWALAQRASGTEKVTAEFRELLLDNVGLAALGLVADVVPLRDENRVFVRHGLKRIATQPTVGLKALCEASGLGKDKPLTSEDVSFKLAPRVNAAGRLGCARLVVDLLTTTNPVHAKTTAEFLEEQNRKRQTIERAIASEAREMVRIHGYDKDPAIVLDAAEWHPGVIGIVAGRLAEQYARPVVLIARPTDAEVVGGSGRAGSDVPLHEAFAACSACLVSHGGHAAAAGLKLLSRNVPAFREAFVAHVGSRFPDCQPPPSKLLLDEELPLAALTLGLMKEIDRLEPYGAENPRPRFLAAGLTLDGEPKVMKERHLSFRVRQGQAKIRAVMWGGAERLDELKSGNGSVCLAFTPRVNEWNGYKNVEVEVVDFQPAASPTLG